MSRQGVQRDASVCVQEVDMAVVGGGLVGTLLASLLSDHGWKVALFEQAKPPAAGVTQRHPLNQFCTALSAVSQQFLDQHGLWPDVQSDACAIEQVHVSQVGTFGSTRIHARDEGVAALGYVVDNQRFLQALQQRLHSSKVQQFVATRVERIDYLNDWACIDYHTEQEPQSTLHAKLVIAVDGISSSIREQAGIVAQHTDYQQFAILSAVGLSQPHQHVAYERFTPSGPLALLPRPDNTVSVVHSINPEQRAVFEALSDADYLNELQQAFGYRLGRFTEIGPRTVTPLLRIEAQQQTASRLLLMGNAARLIHPVAGQGYNLALRDVRALLQLLTETPEALTDPGCELLLAAFVAAQKADQQSVVRLTDALARTFRGTARLPAHARGLGLLGMDMLPALRHRLARQAMGYVS